MKGYNCKCNFCKINFSWNSKIKVNWGLGGRSPATSAWFPLDDDPLACFVFCSVCCLRLRVCLVGVCFLSALFGTLLVALTASRVGYVLGRFLLGYLCQCFCFIVCVSFFCQVLVMWFVICLRFRLLCRCAVFVVRLSLSLSLSLSLFSLSIFFFSLFFSRNIYIYIYIQGVALKIDPGYSIKILMLP